MTTLASFVDYSGIDSSLIRSTVRQCGGWADFKEMAADVARHGADCGFGNFVYYSDTVAFAKRNKKALLAMVQEYAADNGQDVATFLLGFNCISNEYTSEEVIKALYCGKGDAVTTVYNALAWLALEEIARSYDNKF